MPKSKTYRTEVRSDDENADIPSSVEFTIDTTTATDIIRLASFVEENRLYKVERFDCRAIYSNREGDLELSDMQADIEAGNIRTDAEILHVSSTEFWFSACIKHTSVVILSELQRIDDLAAHFGIDGSATAGASTSAQADGIHSAVVELLDDADDAGCSGDLIVVTKSTLRELARAVLQEIPAWLG